jgi:hypothetical protein
MMHTVPWMTRYLSCLAAASLSATNTNSGLAAGDGLLIAPAGNQVVANTLSTNP